MSDAGSGFEVGRVAHGDPARFHGGPVDPEPGVAFPRDRPQDRRVRSRVTGPSSAASAGSATSSSPPEGVRTSVGEALGRSGSAKRGR